MLKYKILYILYLFILISLKLVNCYNINIIKSLKLSQQNKSQNRNFDNYVNLDHTRIYSIRQNHESFKNDDSNKFKFNLMSSSVKLFFIR